jgi:hypothetical protein
MEAGEDKTVQTEVVQTEVTEKVRPDKVGQVAETTVQECKEIMREALMVPV